MNTALNLVIQKFSSHSSSGPTKSLQNSAQFFSDLEQTATHVFFGHAIYSNHFVARLLTAFKRDGMPGHLKLLCEKADQRCIRSSFDRGCAEFDLNRAGVFAHNTLYFAAGNNVNAQNCHSPMVSERKRTCSTDFHVPCHDVGA